MRFQINKVARTLVLIGLLAALVACSNGTSQMGQPSSTTNEQPPARPTALPTRAVTAVKTVSADGLLALSSPTFSLSFAQVGKVTQVNVVAGQSVKKGDVLATVDDTELQDALVDAKLNLAQVEASIAQLNTPPTKEELAAAQAALSSASSNYSTTKAGNTATEIETARRNYESAWLGYLAAQTNRDVHCGTSAGTQINDCQMQEAQYGSAFEGMLSAKASYEAMLQPVSSDTLTQAYTSVANAKAKLDALNTTVTEEQKSVNTVQYAQAKAAIERAQANLAKAMLVAPCDCVVQAVNAVVGTTTSDAAFTLVDLSGLQFKATNVAETNVALIKEGATVTLRLKSYETEFTGKVTTVLAQSSGAQNGVALYTVLIALDPTGSVLLPGMTGQAEIAISGQ